MVNLFRAAAAGVLALVVGAAQAAPAVANQLAAGYPGSISVSSTSPLAIRYSTSQPDDRNWVGIWASVNGGGPDNQQVGAQPSRKWAYASGLDGTVTLPTDGLAAGDYTAYFLARDGYNWMAAPVQFSLGGSGGGGALKVTGGYPIRIQYNTSQPNANNWLGIYFAAAGGPDTGSVGDPAVRWAYAGDAQGTVEIPTDGLGDGLYKAFLLADGGYASLAQPQIFTQGNAVFRGVLAVDYAAKTAFSFRYTTQKPGAKNWIGVWAYGKGPDGQEAVGQALAWEYATEARATLTVDVSKLPAGQYQAFLLADDKYNWLASPIAIHK
ncbi:hypothetical protein ISF_03158 [Cordyceps fumosorosea ARSEF 2679]|uniref:Uncharacterized protein n=1 Tax=Cordyceps fumosorosea (strain ARSEF 2679) TaxID=1081104 RepID=A0A168BBH1_CORFA|nr:hypothetical protein ISF_03158 [Cordyceps fumosorosea ARSEF 2679]OAA69888.1 hypothetical protein ISF_03158 [Cordyceps fumosorosea ARSEF 2679]